MSAAKEMIRDLLHPFYEAMAEARITPRLLARRLKKELDAKETKYFQYQGKIISQRNEIAWGIRQAARIDAQKLLGAYPSEKIEFPDKHGRPQQIDGGIFSDPERAARLIYLIQQAQKRDKAVKDKAVKDKKK